MSFILITNNQISIKCACIMLQKKELSVADGEWPGRAVKKKTAAHQHFLFEELKGIMKMLKSSGRIGFP